MTDLLQRPDSFDFALDFLGGSDAEELLAYVEALEGRLRQVTEVTDEELDKSFLQWWDQEGSGMLPRHWSGDGEERAQHVAEIAWYNGAYIIQEAARGGSRHKVQQVEL
jgi:hypothetical protein